METTIENRNDAYHSLDLSKRQKQVLDVVTKLEKATNKDIANYLNVPINCITGRVKELRDKGHLVSLGKKKDAETKVNVTVFGLRFKETLF